MKRLKMMTGVLAVICTAGLLAGCKNEGNTVNNAAGVTADITAVTAAGNTTGKAIDDFTNNTAGEAAGHTVALTLDMRGFYTGFTGLPGDYTMEEAAAAGYVVLHNSELAEGQEVWDKFMNSAVQGSNNGIRIANFFDDETESPFYCDLFVQDKKYYLFDNTAESQKQEPFAHLLSLTGQVGNPLKDSRFIVLTDDSNLTFEDIWKSMISSDTAVINSIAPHRVVRMIFE
ncbi:hypothetical protein [Paenibacillus sp. FSL P4-0081]|uniref:hypothetical protein n=1 Tax=Paenibacillus sp. FSL P4-0081 TaxID=1536769 RepID=UPI0012E08883|nr:hypothetical protein [Paenibacillus sp. FSL P4-0081]